MTALTVEVRDELETARRNVYRLQTGGVRLCDALRTIANGCDNPEQVAKKALAHKEPDPDWNRIEHLQSEIERLTAALEAIRDATATDAGHEAEFLRDAAADCRNEEQHYKPGSRFGRAWSKNADALEAEAVALTAQSPAPMEKNDE